MGRLAGILAATLETPLGVVDGVSDRHGHGHGHRALAEPSTAQAGSMRGTVPAAVVLTEEVADGG